MWHDWNGIKPDIASQATETYSLSSTLSTSSFYFLFPLVSIAASCSIATLPCTYWRGSVLHLLQHLLYPARLGLDPQLQLHIVPLDDAESKESHELQNTPRLALYSVWLKRYGQELGRSTYIAHKKCVCGVTLMTCVCASLKERHSSWDAESRIDVMHFNTSQDRHYRSIWSIRYNIAGVPYFKS